MSITQGLRTPISGANGSPPSEGLAEMVVSIIAEVTRYPRDILHTGANLEEDLGIDSVKRAEILAVLRSRLDLPERGDAAAVPPRTIGDVVTAVEAYFRQQPLATNGTPKVGDGLRAGSVEAP